MTKVNGRINEPLFSCEISKKSKLYVDIFGIYVPILVAFYWAASPEEVQKIGFLGVILAFLFVITVLYKILGKKWKIEFFENGIRYQGYFSKMEIPATAISSFKDYRSGFKILKTQQGSIMLEFKLTNEELMRKWLADRNF